MIAEKFVIEYDDFFEKLLTRFKNKNAEYANQSDVFSNFRKSSLINLKTEYYSHKPHVEAFRYAKKHLLSCIDIISEPEKFTDEQIEEKFGDLILYFTIIYIMLTNKSDL